MTSLFELSEKWKTESLLSSNTRDRTQTIHEMKRKINMRNEHCFSENRIHTEVKKKKRKPIILI